MIPATYKRKYYEVGGAHMHRHNAVALPMHGCMWCTSQTLLSPFSSI